MSTPSPFVRFCRWSMLAVGLGYGYIHNKSLHRFERKLKRENDAIAARNAAKEQSKVSSNSTDCGCDSPNFSLEDALKSLDNTQSA